MEGFAGGSVDTDGEEAVEASGGEVDIMFIIGHSDH
jgi:hypothetical protein